MKVKTVSRSEEQYTRDSRQHIQKVHRNLDPSLHPFEQAREYQRALTATKVDKIFARPFLGALDGHSDGVFCSATSPKSLVAFLSGSCDGEIRVWDLAFQRCMWATYAHTGFVRGLTVAPDGLTFFSCGDDKTIKQFPLISMVGALGGGAEEAEDDEDTKHPEPKLFSNPAEDVVSRPPLNTWTSRQAFTGIDHHWQDRQFATSGQTVDIWDHNRSDPVHSFAWGADSVLSVKYNPAEPSLLVSTASDRNVVLYDARAATAVRKVVLSMISNAAAWNPREPFNFTLANEDHNCYTFDMRKLDRALMIHKDHVGAVLDVSYSPTGKEFVSGSYDRTVRIFPVQQGKSREVYHTRRMQRIFCVKFSADARYVLSGSDDTNLRIWKAQASEKLGKLAPRERAKRDYETALKRRYSQMPELRRIANHRHVPRVVLKSKKQRLMTEESESRHLENRISHSAPGTVKRPVERTKGIVREMS